MKRSDAFRNTMARKPSHLGSNNRLPSTGSSSASFASIGSTGGGMANVRSGSTAVMLLFLAKSEKCNARAARSVQRRHDDLERPPSGPARAPPQPIVRDGGHPLAGPWDWRQHRDFHADRPDSAAQATDRSA